MSTIEFNQDILTSTRWFKSQPTASFADVNIDEENGIIKDVVMCQVGPAKGHGVHLEQEMIDQLAAYYNSNFGEKGLKSRFSHPSMSDSTMGTQLGIFKNVRVKDDKTVGDLHLLKSAEISPSKPGMRSWMLSMAKERPDFVMSSIVFSTGEVYQRKADGEKVVLRKRKGKTNEFESLNDHDPKLGNIYLGLGENGDWHYTDMVEAGAATDSLFAQSFNKDHFAVQAVEFLQDHPEIYDFLKTNPGKLVEFANKAGISLPNATPAPENLFSQIKEYVFGKKEDIPTTDLSRYILLDDHNSAIAEFEKQAGILNDNYTELEKQLTAKNEEITALEAKVKLLEKQPDQAPTSLSEEPLTVATDKPLYLMDSNTQKMRKLNK